MAKCRITGGPLEECINLGEQYVSSFVPPGKQDMGDIGSLRVGIGVDSGLVQLYESFPLNKMYKRYWYHSGINGSMRKELRSIVESAMSFVHLEPGDTVLDIASNDGTMLTYYPETVNRIGIDPSDVAVESSLYKDNLVLANDFFDAEAYKNITDAKAKIVTAIAVFYDIEEPLKFLHQVREIIDDHGVFIIQISYTPLMLEQNEFGNICHEHICYYTVSIVKSLLESTDFEVFDVVMNPTNGGSVRIYAMPKNSAKYLACPLNWLSIGHARVIGILEYEKQKNLDSPEPYLRFAQRIEVLKEQTVAWLQQQKEAKKTVVGYGASTKGNVLLQYYGIGTDLLPCIADANKKKWGLCTIGTGIPIISEEEMRRMKPDYLLALPWFFMKYFLEREKDLLAGGTRFVTPQPQLQIIGR
jgi:hypothetical protein